MLICLGLACRPGYSQRYNFRKKPQAEGLLNQTAEGPVQDRTGHSRVATYNPLFRYDGISFRRFGTRHPDNSNFIAKHVASDGSLWLTSLGGSGKAGEDEIETLDPIDFEILPPWYSSLGFTVPLSLALAAGAVLFWRWRYYSLLEQQRTLALRVEERTRDLKAEIRSRAEMEEALVTARDAAERASRVKSEFLANVSHEIRTPMNGIIGMTELALETELTEQQREYLTITRESAEGLLNILNDILDFSKMEAGKMSLNFVVFDLRGSLESALRAVTLSAQSKGLNLVSDVHPSTPQLINSDPMRLRQVLLNLLGNAIKFTRRGEVRLTVSLAEGSSGTLHLAVSDTGIGVPKDKQREIFGAFSQADSSTTKQFGGTGLGLSISSRLVELIGGAIWLESEEGRGSEFHVTWPFQPASGEAWPLGSGSQQPRESGSTVAEQAQRERMPASLDKALRVLVAEDRPTNQVLLTQLLGNLGHSVVIAENGQQAVRALEEDRFDLVLMDVQMPVMDGLEATVQIRNLDRQMSRYTPIVAVTAHAMKGDKERCLAVGMDGYLSKPILPHELNETLRQVVSSH